MCRRSTAGRRSSRAWGSGTASSFPAPSRGHERFLLRAGELFQLIFAAQRRRSRPAAPGVHERDGTTAARVFRAAPAVVRMLALLRIARVAGVERAVRTPDAVDVVQR